MIADILTVAGKELREIFTFGDARGRSKYSLLVLVIVFGIVFPLQSGREWVDSPVNIMVWGWMPFLWVSGVVADMFAGERERHTLEALLIVTTVMPISRSVTCCSAWKHIAVWRS